MQAECHLHNYQAKFLLCRNKTGIIDFLLKKFSVYLPTSVYVGRMLNVHFNVPSCEVRPMTDRRPVQASCRIMATFDAVCVVIPAIPAPAIVLPFGYF